MYWLSLRFRKPFGHDRADGKRDKDALKYKIVLLDGSGISFELHVSSNLFTFIPNLKGLVEGKDSVPLDCCISAFAIFVTRGETSRKNQERFSYIMVLFFFDMINPFTPKFL